MGLDGVAKIEVAGSEQEGQREVLSHLRHIGHQQAEDAGACERVAGVIGGEGQQLGAACKRRILVGQQRVDVAKHENGKNDESRPPGQQRHQHHQAQGLQAQGGVGVAGQRQQHTGANPGCPCRVLCRPGRALEVGEHHPPQQKRDAHRRVPGDARKLKGPGKAGGYGRRPEGIGAILCQQACEHVDREYRQDADKCHEGAKTCDVGAEHRGPQGAPDNEGGALNAAEIHL